MQFLLNKTIAASANNSIFIDEEFKIWTFGAQLRDRITRISASHYFIRQQPRIVSGALGHDHAVFLDDNGQVWVMGNNAGVNWTHPVGIDWEQYLEPIEYIPKIIAVACGDFHSLLLDEDGYVWGSGQNESGELGDPRIEPNKPFAKISHLKNIQAIHCASKYSLFLQKDGLVFISGVIPGTTNTSLRVINGIPRIKAISGGANFYLLIDTSGHVWACGANESGQLGLGHKTQVIFPTKIPTIPRMRACSGGANFAFFLGEDHSLWSVGANAFGNLGDGRSGVLTLTPKQLANIPPIQAVSCGVSHSLFIDFQGVIWACGDATKLPISASRVERYTTLTKIPFATQVLECYSEIALVKSARKV